MSVLDARPVPMADCGPSSCGCGSGAMNYDGGDCLPGSPGPVPSASCGCGTYTSGMPFEGDPLCPKCAYCVTDESGNPCWSVQLGLTGRAVFDSPQEHWEVDPIELGFSYTKRGAPANQGASSWVLKGVCQLVVQYLKPPPYPAMVLVEVHITAVASNGAGPPPVSGSAENGLGDPFVNNASDGTHKYRLVVDETGKATRTFFVRASTTWAFQAYCAVGVSGSAKILPCEDLDGA